MLKDAEPEELLSALLTVYRGDAVISPRATKRLVHSMRDLPPTPFTEVSYKRIKVARN